MRNAKFDKFSIKKFLLILRGISLLVFIPIHTVVLSSLVIVIRVFGLSQLFSDRLVIFWARSILFFCGIKIHVKGEENRLEGRGFVYLFTHSSYLDIPVIVASSPKKFFSFGAKKSLFSIPFFGKAMSLLKILPITRDDRQKAIHVYRQAEARLLKGEIFALSPEGGRRRGDKIGDFKSGPFIFAVNTEAPLVPIVLCGVDRCLKKGSILINTDFLVKTVGVHILPSVETSAYTIENLKELKDRVHGQVTREMESMKKIYL